jgi:UDP-N-acetylglucosamine--N-acetylmuramyl-(pentapeptide) pyrophosphoryl-undecaprenol N-acetylglucosamine transferase
MGGFAAGPVVMIAALFGRYTAIAEQNAVAGRTNRILGRFVKRIFLAFGEAAGSFPSHKVRVTGNPIRPELVERAGRILPQHWEGRPGETFHLLIFGGSQGARNINLFVMEALPWLAEIPYALEVFHQTGAKLVDELREAYAARGMTHRVVAFIEEMDQAYQWAHLILCRAGATSLAEIALFRKPSILIPFPHATDDHQEHNAGVFESAGAAVMLKEEGLNGRHLAEVVRGLAHDPKRLRAMGEQAMKLARADAASRIVQECLALLGEEAWDG